jgi:hypothetical protein
MSDLCYQNSEQQEKNMTLSREGIAGLERWLDRNEDTAGDTLKKFKAEVSKDDGSILWAMRDPYGIVLAAVAQRRYKTIRNIIARYNRAVAGEDAEFTAAITKELGGLDEEHIVKYLNDSFTEELIRNSRYGNNDDMEKRAEREVLARILDDRAFYW